MTVHPLDDLAAYALGALDPEERRSIDAHLETCPSCRAELRSFAETTWEIAETQRREVPPGLRAAIVDRARRDGSGWAGRLAALLNDLRRPVPLAVPTVSTTAPPTPARLSVRSPIDRGHDRSVSVRRPANTE